MLLASVTGSAAQNPAPARPGAPASTAAPRPAAAANDAAPLPLDPAIRSGTLPNGLTYYVRRNGKPEKHVLLRLAVKAGSIDEAEDQRGLAHVLEHMAFNGSTHFKPGELVSYLESIGSRFGPHVNASTSYDETIYMLDVPTDREGAIGRAFEALSDYAGGITLDPKEIDKERGVVMEEWRLRQGAGMRMLQPQLAAIYGDSRYLQRLPIGTPEILQTFTPARLRDFYRTFYRPDRMGVVVVGDVDPAAMERLVREHFGPLRAAARAARPAYPIPTHQETRYASVSDPEAQGSSVTLIHKLPLETLRTAADYRRVLMQSLVHQMMNQRFAEIARRPNAPFLRAGSGTDTFGRTVEAFTVSAQVQDGTTAAGLTAIAQEVARVRQHGFGEGELARGKASMTASYERAYNERDKSESDDFASELVRHFLEGEAAPGIATELQLVRRFLPAITVAEVGALAKELLPETNRVVLATAPQKTGVAPVTEVALREALGAGATAAVTAWLDETTGRELMPNPPAGGTVRSRREIPELGVTVLSLSNGAEVWLKPTDFRNDQIVFSAYGKGGTSELTTRAAYVNASLATSLVGAAGIGGFSPTDLGKVLAGKIATASAFISDYTQGLSGSSTPKDLETALQLLHLNVTAPNQDRTAFDLLKRRLEASLANREQNPAAVFGDRVRRVNTLDHFTSRPLSTEDLATLDPEQMLAFYKGRFANAANFTFFFVGAFKVDEVAPLLARYIGSLPSRGTADAQYGQQLLQFPPSVVRDVVRKGREPRSQTAITFFSDTVLEEFEVHRLRAATAVLQTRLREILREELGGTYSVGVGYSDTSPVAGYGTTAVQFGSSPENVDKLTGAVMQEVERLRREGPSLTDVQAIKQAEKNELETSLRQNGYWLNSLQSMHILGRDARRILLRIERAESLSQENIHAALRKYLPADRHTVVTLMPETSGAPGAPAAAPSR